MFDQVLTLMNIVALSCFLIGGTRLAMRMMKGEGDLDNGVLYLFGGAIFFFACGIAVKAAFGQ